MPTLLQDFSTAAAELIARAQSSVVRLEARRGLPASGLIWSEDGLIITANHVIRHEEKIDIALSSGETHAATLVGRDPATDVALVRIPANHLAVLPTANLDDLKVGHLALALGRPGQRVQATMGMVSGVGDKWRTPWGGVFEIFLRTAMEMYPGFSGGPLLNMSGEVLGLNNAALSRHFNLAAPVTALQRIAQELLQHGRVRRGYLGIGVQPVDLPPAVRQQTGSESGLLIVSVAPGSPAEKHNLLLGDTIIALDGGSVEHVDQLLASLGADRIQQEIQVTVMRAGQLQEVKVAVGESA